MPLALACYGRAAFSSRVPFEPLWPSPLPAYRTHTHHHRPTHILPLLQTRCCPSPTRCKSTAQMPTSFMRTGPSGEGRRWWWYAGVECVCEGGGRAMAWRGVVGGRPLGLRAAILDGSAVPPLLAGFAPPLLFDEAAQPASLPPFLLRDRSWVPPNATYNGTCQMLAASELPESFLLVRRRRCYFTVSSLRCSLLDPCMLHAGGVPSPSCTLSRSACNTWLECVCRGISRTWRVTWTTAALQTCQKWAIPQAGMIPRRPPMPCRQGRRHRCSTQHNHRSMQRNHRSTGLHCRRIRRCLTIHRYRTVRRCRTIRRRWSHRRRWTSRHHHTSCRRWSRHRR
jgi:hypothetical protein